MTETELVEFLSFDIFVRMGMNRLRPVQRVQECVLG